MSTSSFIPPIATSGSSTVPGATVSGATSSAGSTKSSTNSSSGSTAALSLASNFNTFLTLLTTQLQNQDPTNPTDTNQFTQQLVSFAGVQQQVQSNALLQQLVTATQTNQVSSASPFVGTSIQATGNQAGLSGGNATLGYTLASAASAAIVTVKDSSGNTVFVGQGTTTAGSNTVSWNGLNSFTGKTAPDGTYTVSVTAVDSNNSPITATPFITGTVSSASISNGAVMLNVNGLQVPEGNVTSVTNLPSASSTATNAANSAIQQLLQQATTPATGS